MIKLIILLFSIVLWQHNIHAIIFNKENPIYYFTNQEEQINDLKEFSKKAKEFFKKHQKQINI